MDDDGGATATLVELPVDGVVAVVAVLDDDAPLGDVERTEFVPADGATATDGAMPDPPTLTVGVASAPSAVDAGPELPPLLTNAAAAAPPIAAERMKSFLFDDFLFRTLLCGITTRETESL